MNHSLADAGGVRLLCLAIAILLGLSASCSEKKPPANIPTTIDGNDPRPHLVTIAFQNRGEGPSTAHYTYNGREMGTYSDGLRNVVRELEAAPEPYVLILHEPGYSIADAGGDVDDLNAEFTEALAGKRVLQYGLAAAPHGASTFVRCAHSSRRPMTP